MSVDQIDTPDLRANWQKMTGRFGIPQKFPICTRVRVRQDGAAPLEWCRDWASVCLTIVGVQINPLHPDRVEYLVHADGEKLREFDAFAERWLEELT